MKHIKPVLIPPLFSLLLIFSSCIPQNTIPTATKIAMSATSMPIQSPQPTVSITPTSEVYIRQSKIEVVARDAATGDGGNSWGGHQTRIVRTQDGVFTAYTAEGSGYFSREWRLVKRKSDGSWGVIAHGTAGKDPVNLLASPDGTLHIVGWPGGQATIWSGKPENGAVTMKSEPIPNQLHGNWPYNSAGIDEDGDLCVLSSEGGEQPGGRFYVACYIPSKGKWISQTVFLDYRFCYTYVFPGLNGNLSLVSTRDVRWEALGYQQPPGTFDYVFNAYGYWHTDDISANKLDRIYEVEEKPTQAYPVPDLNAQQDAYLDTKGEMHVLYHIQGATTHGAWISRHAIIPPNGDILFDEQLPSDAGDFARIFQDMEGRFYLLGSSGKIYPMGEDGREAGEPVDLDFGVYQVEYSGFGVSVPRTGTPLGNVVDVVFPSTNGTRWVYFQLEFSDE
jgi:hypothetical protein